jgi:hypothetical protein
MKKLWLTFGLLGVVLQLGYSADPNKRWFRLDDTPHERHSRTPAPVQLSRRRCA